MSSGQSLSCDSSPPLSRRERSDCHQPPVVLPLCFSRPPPPPLALRPPTVSVFFSSLVLACPCQMPIWPGSHSASTDDCLSVDGLFSRDLAE